MNTGIGLFAAFCTTISYFPQLKKCWETNSAGDLSLKMFLILGLGVATWVVYGFLQGDIIIIIANSASLCLLLHFVFQVKGAQRCLLPLISAAKHALASSSSDAFSSREPGASSLENAPMTSLFRVVVETIG